MRSGRCRYTLDTRQRQERTRLRAVQVQGSRSLGMRTGDGAHHSWHSEVIRDHPYQHLVAYQLVDS